MFVKKTHLENKHGFHLSMHSCVHSLGHNDQQDKLTDMHIQFSLADMSTLRSRDYMAAH